MLDDNFLYGSVVGGSFIFFIFMLIIFLLSTDRLLTKKLLIIIAIAFVLRVITLNFYALTPTDSSISYFPDATLVFGGFGSHFASYISGILKLLGFETLLSQYYFSNAMGFLGGYFYFKVYLFICRDANFSHREYDHCGAYALIWLWPSSLLWTTGIGKDSLMYLCLAIFLYGATIIRFQKIKAIFLWIISLFLIWMLRPQIFIPLVGALFLLSLFSQKISIQIRLFILVIFVVAIIYLLPEILQYGRVQGVGDIAARAVQSQGYLSSGTAIFLPTQNSHLVFFFLPYTMLANLFFPIFLGIRNVTGAFASVENLILLFLVWQYIRMKSVFFVVFSSRTQLFVKYIQFYLVGGIAVLGLLNVNLGLAMREKLMFTAPFLVLLAVSVVFKTKYGAQLKLRHRHV